MRASACGVSRFLVPAIFLFCAGLTFPAPASAQYQRTERSTATAESTNAVPVAPQAASPAAVTSEITQAAVRGGVLTCANRIDQISKYLTGDTQNGAFLFLPKRQPDQGIFSASLEVPVQNAGPVYVSVGFASNALGGCGAAYDTVEYSASACADVEKNVLKGLKRSGVIKKDIMIFSAGTVKIFLMPAGTGCVIIKKEVVQ